MQQYVWETFLQWFLGLPLTKFLQYGDVWGSRARMQQGGSGGGGAKAAILTAKVSAWEGYSHASIESQWLAMLAMAPVDNRHVS